MLKKTPSRRLAMFPHDPIISALLPHHALYLKYIKNIIFIISHTETHSHTKYSRWGRLVEAPGGDACTHGDACDGDAWQLTQLTYNYGTSVDSGILCKSANAQQIPLLYIYIIYKHSCAFLCENGSFIVTIWQYIQCFMNFLSFNTTFTYLFDILRFLSQNQVAFLAALHIQRCTFSPNRIWRRAGQPNHVPTSITDNHPKDQYVGFSAQGAGIKHPFSKFLITMQGCRSRQLFKKGTNEVRRLLTHPI